MFQHYLWLVVFMWMIIEGFVMYLALIKVFDSYVSRYILKFNLAAWCKSNNCSYIDHIMPFREKTS